MNNILLARYRAILSRIVEYLFVQGYLFSETLSKASGKETVTAKTASESCTDVRSELSGIIVFPVETLLHLYEKTIMSAGATIDDLESVGITISKVIANAGGKHSIANLTKGDGVQMMNINEAFPKVANINYSQGESISSIEVFGRPVSYMIVYVDGYELAKNINRATPKYSIVTHGQGAISSKSVSFCNVKAVSSDTPVYIIDITENVNNAGSKIALAKSSYGILVTELVGVASLTTDELQAILMNDISENISEASAIDKEPENIFKHNVVKSIGNANAVIWENPIVIDGGLLVRQVQLATLTDNGLEVE